MATRNFRLLFAVLSLVIFLFPSCNSNRPIPGDLVFVVGSGSRMSEAITSSTAAGNEEAQYDHVGIVAECDGGLFVIEALPQEGVTLTPWSQFVEAAPKVEGKPGICVKRLTAGYDREAALRRALSYLGRPYDFEYDNDNQAIYCSELVWLSYLDEKGAAIFGTVPMNFAGPDGKIPDFWLDLFEEMGLQVPQGEPGTNPNQIARDPRLVEVPLPF